jgi:hypothetical protein
MTTVPGSPPASQQAAVDAALLVLKSMGLSLEDLTAAPGQRPAVPTFAEYVPVVSAAVTDGTCRAYGSYWNRITEQWGGRRLDEPTPSEVRQLPAGRPGPRGRPQPVPASLNHRLHQRTCPQRHAHHPADGRQGYPRGPCSTRRR